MIITREIADGILEGMGFELVSQWPEEEVVEMLERSPFLKKARVANLSETIGDTAKLMARLARGARVEIGEEVKWGYDDWGDDGDSA